ncbi:unnamed protein product [Owenia fusiformis]|uniref:Uncharacterized protein n=1 Tax=Owenia fusiformis TaxID=6347 RepID=A0A8J1XQF4_OWEFU|nr:unnamed protein product [Owenia fusiformis]
MNDNAFVTTFVTNGCLLSHATDAIRGDIDNGSVGPIKGEVDIKKRYGVNREINDDDVASGGLDNQEESRESELIGTKKVPEVGVIKSTKWIVVTSISSPTHDIERLAKLSEWQLLVVADKETPENWHYDGVIFLSIATQKSLGYKILEYIPFSNYGRKNIGYLYAVQHGAQLIYDTDDDNHPTDDLRGFIITDMMYGVVPSSETTVLNPYAYYGQPTTWPRGFPLDKIGDNITSDYNAVHWKTALIQQGAVDGDPDVDAIFRLTCKSNIKSLNITYDHYMPPLLYPKGTFVPWNSQNTLFRYNAFWGLLLPTTVTFRVTDIWRGYSTQTLLWLIGGFISYMPPNGFQLRNNHSYIGDIKQKKKLYDQTGDLLQFLSDWKCNSNSLYACMQILADNMVNEGFLDIADAKLTAAWLHDLVAIGYKFPDIVTTERHGESLDYPIILQSDNRFPMSIPSDSKLVYIGEKKSKIKSLYHKMCLSFNTRREFNKKLLIQPKPILLLIIFNNNLHYENIPYLEALYDGHFVKTIYCGPEIPSKSILQDWNINFIKSERKQDALPGFYNYECVVKAMKLGLRVKGILTIADDVFMKVKTISKLPVDEIWFNSRGFKTEKQFSEIVKKPSIIRTRDSYSFGDRDIGRMIASVEPGRIKMCNISNLKGKCQVTPRNIYLKTYETNIINAFEEFYRLKNSNNIIKTFLHGLSKELLGTKRLMFDAADVYYLPQKHFDVFVSIAQIFYNHRVLLEVAVPTILHSLIVNDSNMAVAAYNWDYGNTREKPWLRFQAFLYSSLSFLHPVKLQGITRNDKKTTEIFCVALNSQHFTNPFETYV